MDRKAALDLILCIVQGAVIASLAWSHPSLLWLLILFPVALGLARSRLHAFAVALGYFGVNHAEIPGILLTFFHGELLWLALLAPLALTLILAAPFALIGPGRLHDRPGLLLRRFGLAFLAFAILTLPPVGFIGWMNPLFAAGAFFPDSGWSGIVNTALFFSVLVAVIGRDAEDRTLLVCVREHLLQRKPFDGHMLAPLAVLVFLLLISLWRHHAYDQRQAERPAILGVHAIDTQHGEPMNKPAYRERVIEAMVRTIDTYRGAQLLVFPESILHSFNDTDRLMLLPLVTRPDRPVVLFGATLDRPDGHIENGLISLEPDFPLVITSRLPAPIGNWRPFTGAGVRANPFGSDMIRIGDLDVAVSICYEDGVLWGHPGLLTGRADLLVSAGNEWALADSRTARRQAVAAWALARMGGVPLRRATNE